MTLSRTPFTLAAATLLTISALAGCGGDNDEASQPTLQASTSEPNADSNTTTALPEATGGEVGGADDFEPGSVGYRVVNLLEEPVDVYARTDGIVEAFLVAEAVEFAGVTDYLSPPEGGHLVVAKAGASDPTCVGSCPDLIVETSPQLDDGDSHTVVIYEDSGQQSGFTLWENAIAPRGSSSNVMPPADPDRSIVVVTAIAVPDAEFGLRLAIAGTPGCQESIDGANVLIGGNQTPAYAFSEDSVEVTLHDSTDPDCSGDPVGGPFEVSGGAGTRSHLILNGTLGEMGTVKLAMP